MANVPDDVWPGGMPAVGQMVERSSKVHRSDIEHFTDISGDRNPLHYDEAVARRTRFGEIVAQGGVTSAILHAVVAEDLPGPWDSLSPGQLELQGAGAARRHHHRPRGGA